MEELYNGKGLIIEKVKRKRFELIFIIYQINLILNIFNISLKLNLIVFIVKQIPSCSMANRNYYNSILDSVV